MRFLVCLHMDGSSFSYMHAFLPRGVVGLAAVAWALWNCRNKVTFDKYVLHSPFEIVFAACSFLLMGRIAETG